MAPSQRASAGLRLIGSLRVAGDDRWLGAAFDRLCSEVLPPGEKGRVMRFDSASPGEPPLAFLGLDVADDAAVPAGLQAWELHDASVTVRATGEDGACIAWRGNLDWQWRDRTPDGRVVGEFAASCLTDLGDARRRAFWMSAHARVGQAVRPGSDAIRLVDYDPDWPRQFDACADWLRAVLGADVALRIEHYGSTAIPGMPAKPVVDLLVEVPSFPAARQRAVPRLGGGEWEYWHYRDHLVFIRRDPGNGVRTHHLHLAPGGHPVWRGLAFRDCLRAHPEMASRYAALKRRLAEEYPDDREGYTRGKTEFVREIDRRWPGSPTGDPERI